MSVIMGVASPYWMKSIEPAVTSTLQRISGAVKAQAQSHIVHTRMDQFRPAAETISMNSNASSAVKTDSATGQKTGGQK
jgi:hypothetical protein